jgi:stage II sporulation protein M
MSFRKYLIIAAILFALGLSLGLLIPIDGFSLLSGELEALEEIAGFISPLPQASLFLFIFLKNLSVIVISFLFSPLFCLVPVLVLVINGGVIGLVSAMVIKETSFLYLIAGLLPHGILELPALLIGEAFVLSFGMAVVQSLSGKEQKGQIKTSLRMNLKYLIISFSLFLGAALIETFVTPLILDMVA